MVVCRRDWGGILVWEKSWEAEGSRRAVREI